MEQRQQVIIRLAALGTRPELAEPLRAEFERVCVREMAPRIELYECGLMLHLFAGFPAALEYLRVLRTIWPLSIPAIGQESHSHIDRHAERFANGKLLFNAVYGRKALVVERGLESISPELANWAILDGYGKTLSRPELDLVTRELCIVAMLTQLGWSAQLKSHLMGALNVGATRADVVEAIEIAGLGDNDRIRTATNLFELVS